MSITVVTPPAAADAVRARIPSAVVLPEWTWQSIAPGKQIGVSDVDQLRGRAGSGFAFAHLDDAPPATRISPRTGSTGPLTTRPAIERSTAGISGPGDDMGALGEAEPWRRPAQHEPEHHVDVEPRAWLSHVNGRDLRGPRSRDDGFGSTYGARKQRSPQDRRMVPWSC